MNFPIPLFALMTARQANDSAADAGRIALVSMLVKPPMLGLLLAVVMAKRATPAPAVVVANTTTSDTTTSQGALVLKQVAPETDLHSFFPSFIRLTRNQAVEYAKELKLNVKFVEDYSATTSEEPQDAAHLVHDQKPAPGAGWPRDGKVTLHLS